jgi:hypothetical protein
LRSWCLKSKTSVFRVALYCLIQTLDFRVDMVDGVVVHLRPERHIYRLTKRMLFKKRAHPIFMLCKTFASTLKSRQGSSTEPGECFAPQSFAGKLVARLRRRFFNKSLTTNFNSNNKYYDRTKVIRKKNEAIKGPFLTCVVLSH